MLELGKKDILVLSGEKQTRLTETSKYSVAVIVHLYYLDTLEYYYNYLNSIPKEVDVYVTYTSEEQKDIGEKLKNRPIEYIRCENRGRDISALLVGARAVINKYDYVCFAHDKKAKRKSLVQTTNDWVECLWENTLGGEVYIRNIISQFAEDEKLGLLAPPLPLDDLNTQFYMGQWGENYQNVVELAQQIGIKNHIEQNSDIDVLGTVFWARTISLKKLLNYDWKYEDFLEEPMPNDGVISHAVERILPYVVEDAGYSAKWVMTETYLSMYIHRLRYALTESYALLDSELGVHTVFEAEHFKEQANRIIQFVKKCTKKVYIYGAGVYGASCYKILKHYDIDVEGFVVTDKNHAKCYMEKSVWGKEELDWGNVGGIIIAVDSVYRGEIISDISTKCNNFIEFSRLPDIEK